MSGTVVHRGAAAEEQQPEAFAGAVVVVDAGTADVAPIADTSGVDLQLAAPAWAEAGHEPDAMNRLCLRTSADLKLAELRPARPAGGTGCGHDHWR